MGRKYEMDDLASDAVTRLSDRIPTSLANYDDRRKDPKHPINHEMPASDVPGWIRANYVDAITLLDEMDLPHLLPYCFLAICTMDPRGTTATEDEWHRTFVEFVLNGWPRGDNTSAIIPKKFVVNVLCGYNKLIRAEPKDTMTWFLSKNPNPSDCEKPKRCQATRDEIWRFISWNHSTLGCLVYTYYTSDGIDTLCTTCDQLANTSVLAGRQVVWDKLPDMFGLPPWEELLKGVDEDW